MGSLDDIHPQFITTPDGQKVSVVLPIKEFESLIEDLEDLAIIAERRDEVSIPHEKVIQELKQDGLL